jgi:aerotaxis receptor
MEYKTEKDLSIDYLFISETDEKGIITYANDYFSKICGWSVESLLGKPHNIIRHKDVPAAAFADLWETIQSGLWWNGFVKNKKKDGRYYWVHAIVFPITLANGKKGYRSRRRQATQDEILAAEDIYESLRD